MDAQQQLNYNRIAEAITYLKENFKHQPGLDEVAGKIHLSPYHFQRLFTDWSGVSPKKFLQYISLEYAKQILQNKEATLFDAAYETGLSGTGRLHDLFVKIEGMTPGEYKNGGESLNISYSFANSPFGRVLAATTSKGVCHIGFSDNDALAFQDLKQRFPNASFRETADQAQLQALQMFGNDPAGIHKIKLHLKGTPFQLRVWEALLKIPVGQLSTYGNIAKSIDQAGASRAVGTAIGSNPVAFLIPCHRVIRSSGIIGGYMWGPVRKTAMIGWEAARITIK